MNGEELQYALSAAILLILLALTARSIVKRTANAVAVVLLGGGLTLLYYRCAGVLLHPERASLTFFYSMAQPVWQALSWLRNGLIWLVFYGLIRVQGPVTVRSRLGWIAAVLLSSNLIGQPLLKLQTFVINPYHFPIGWLPDAQSLLSMLTAFPNNLVELGYSTLVVWLSGIWASGSPHKISGGLTALTGGGLGGAVTSKNVDQTTRLLCASALLGHGKARDTIVRWFHDPNRAVALEIGIDLKLAVQVARFAEQRDRRYWWIYFVIFLLAGSAAVIAASSGQPELAMAIALIGSFVAAGFWVRKQIEERNKFVPLFWPGQFNASTIANTFRAELDGEVLSALPGEDQNFFVYGGFIPFVGAGYDLGGWSVAVALDKASESLGRQNAIKPFETPELYAAIDADVQDLALSGLETKDCYFANGRDIRGNRTLLPNEFGRPVQALEPDIGRRYIRSDDETVRHYRCYRVLDWGGELALSYFLRCSLRGNTLFVETKRFLLTPIAAAYRQVDGMVSMEFKEQVGTAIAGLLAGPFLLLVSPFWVWSELSRRWHEYWKSDRARRELIERSPLFNYGTATSLRQAISSSEFIHYFQKIDGDFYNKALEREVLDALVTFLDEHGIETSDLKERQTTILNSGVIVQGGDVKAESLAVGSGSQAVKTVKKVLGGKAKGAGE